MDAFPSNSEYAQNIRLADSDTLGELFKYVTKTFTNEGGQVNFNPTAMDVFYSALKGKRTFQPFGRIKAMPEALPDDGGVYEEELNEITEEAKRQAYQTFYLWSTQEYDWIDQVHLIRLTGYKPNEEEARTMKQLLKHKRK
jgi:hypothetical protein